MIGEVQIISPFCRPTHRHAICSPLVALFTAMAYFAFTFDENLSSNSGTFFVPAQKKVLASQGLLGDGLAVL